MKGSFLAGIFGLFAIVGLCFGAFTTFTDLQTTGDLLVGDDAVITDALTVSGAATLSGGLSGATSITGNTDITGTLDATGEITGDALTISGVVDVAVATPTVVGQLIVDSNYELYISTATDSIADWIKVGTQS